MKHSNRIDFLSGDTKLSKISRGKTNEITPRKVKSILSALPFYNELKSLSSQNVADIKSNKIESEQILPDRAKHGFDAQNPTFKINKIMGNTQAKLIENEKRDFGRVHEDISIRDLKNIPDWVKNDTTVADLINSGIGKLVYYGNLSKETIQSLKLKYDKGFIYYDGLKYIFKRISCVKKVRDEIIEMEEDEYRKLGKIEINDFLKA